MIKSKSRWSASFVLIGALVCAMAEAAAEEPARRVYCYVFGVGQGDKLLRLIERRALFVTPVFETRASDVLLEVEYRQLIPDAGLATCVSDEYEPDIDKAWDDFVAFSRADGVPIVIAPFPED